MRWHPRRETLAAIGFKSGRVSFIDVVSLESYTMPVLNLESMGEEELLEVENMSEEERKKGDVTDMSWDSGEDHLMVSFGNGKLAMINFDGFTSEKAVWKFLFER